MISNEAAPPVSPSNNELDPTVDAKGICQKARRLWLQPEDSSSLNEAELLYRQIWSRHQYEVVDNDVDSSSHHVSKKCKIDSSSKKADGCDGDTDWVRRAGEKLALILLQSGRSREADQILTTLQYTCRLSDEILNYPSEQAEHQETIKVNHHTNYFSGTAPYRTFNNFVTENEMQMFQTVFADPNSDYWTYHNYSVEPPSPYFSYLIPLQKDHALLQQHGIFAFVHRLQIFLQSHFPVKHASYCEMWAHNRDHATGHQFHFDSDNEGCTEVIRNPICSCILYLSDDNIGGPSIITNQRLTSNTLATKGWMCHPQLGRLVVFDGTVLHGVIPGKAAAHNGNPTPRRVSVMFAFWRKIRVRENDDGTNTVGGAARIFPETPQWAKQLRQTPNCDTATTSTTVAGDTTAETAIPVAVKGLTLDHVYVATSNGRPWTRSMGMPNYEEIFQGF